MSKGQGHSETKCHQKRLFGNFEGHRSWVQGTSFLVTYVLTVRCRELSVYSYFLLPLKIVLGLAMLLVAEFGPGLAGRIYLFIIHYAAEAAQTYKIKHKVKTQSIKNRETKFRYQQSEQIPATSEKEWPDRIQPARKKYSARETVGRCSNWLFTDVCCFGVHTIVLKHSVKVSVTGNAPYYCKV